MTQSNYFSYDLSEAAKADKQYIVEKVLAKRLNSNRKWEYSLNWVGFSDKDNTWEAECNIHPDLIADFERKQATEQHSSMKPRSSSPLLKKKKKHSNNLSLSKKDLFGIEKGWCVKAVVGAAKENDSLIVYAVDYIQGSPLLREYIPSDIAQIYIPEKLIEFFQKNIVWRSPNKN